MGIRGKFTVIQHTDPKYLETYWKHWGSGQSITGYQAARLARSAKGADPKKGQPKQCASE